MMNNIIVLHEMRYLMAVLLLLPLLTTVSSSATSHHDDHKPMMITKPGCPERCGSVSIPYPFGTTPGCYYEHSFLITCTNHTTSTNNNVSHHQFLPFFPNSRVSILDIHLEHGELRVANAVISHCLNLTAAGTSDDYAELNTTTNSNFPLSTRNKFTAVGCDVVAAIAGQRGKTFATGCVALCQKTGDVLNGSCSGIGCCKIDIPEGVLDYYTYVQAGTMLNYTLARDFSPCCYAFVVEKGAYNFSSSDVVMSLEKRQSFPVVLDWAIPGNLTCKQANIMKNNSYACLANNSECLDTTNPLGYRCKCLDGYQGNPYLPDGCQDVDECKSTPNPCNITSTCINLPGTFNCSCSKGYEGDGLKNGTGCFPVDGRKDNSAERLYIALGICLLAILALLLGASCIYWGLKKRKLIKLKEKFFQQNGGLLLQQQLAHLKGSTEAAKIFTEDELRRATNNYDASRVLGQGGYGTVYKGVLADNSVVAIKKSKIGNQSQIEQFINEIVVLTQINHRNVVKLLGCCLEAEVPLLVYEFITNGTLYDHIHDKVGKYLPLPWDMRLKVATDTAGAVAYLHSSASMPIIHRDIKTVNILLDENYAAKVSDFGASRLVPLDHTQITTLVQGTLGYLDPEYIHTSQLTDKSDVYSFGVVLAELLTGLKALSFDRPECDVNLSMYFVSSVKEDRVLEIIDKDLIAEENVDQLKAVANISRSCLRMRGEERPSMKEVASELEGLLHKGMHPWEQDDSSSSSEESRSLLYPYNLDETNRTVDGSST